MKSPWIRLEEHRAGVAIKNGGKASSICAAFIQKGFSINISRVWWDVPQKEEYRIKNWGGMKRYCPACQAIEAGELFRLPDAASASEGRNVIVTKENEYVF